MKKYRLLIPAILFLNTALTADVAKKVDQFLDVSGADKQISSYPLIFKNVAEQAVKRKPDLSRGEQKKITELMLKSFDAEIFRKSIRSALISKMSEPEMDEILKFYETDVARSITELEVKASSPEGMENLQNFDPESVAPEKRNEIDKIISALNLFESTHDTQKTTMLAMLQVVMANLPPEQQRSPEQLNADIDKILEKLKPQSELTIRVNLYMIYAPASLKVIKSYVAYLSQPATKKLYSNYNRGKREALESAAAAFGQSLIDHFKKNKSD